MARDMARGVRPDRTIKHARPLLVRSAAIDRSNITVQSASPTGERAWSVGDREASCSALVICSSGSASSRPL
jgi:hypothetical protein